MLYNYLVTTIRSFRRNKTYTLLNVFGLALGIGCAMVIYSIIAYETSFDRHQENYTDLYRVVRIFKEPAETTRSASVPHPLGNALRENYSFINEVVKIHFSYGGVVASWDGDEQLKRLSEDGNMAFVSPSFFRAFTFPSVSGDLAEGVAEPNSAVISDEWAKKYFGVDDRQLEQVIGKALTIDASLRVIVKGIFEAPPKNSDFPFHLLMHYENIGDVNDYYQEGKHWDSMHGGTSCFVLMKDEADKTQLLSAFPGLIEKYANERVATKLSYDLQPFSEVHFDPELGNYGTHVANKQLLMVLAAIGIFLIITACINFTNLATAQAVKRSKEIGIRKVMGGQKSQLILQFYSETLLITFFASMISLAVAELILIQIQGILGYRLFIDFTGNAGQMAFLMVSILVVTLLAGFYPALILARMNPVLAIKNKITSQKHSGGLSLRRTLVICQFMISQGMIICTIVVANQLRYIQDQPLGFNTEAIITSFIPEREPEKIETLRTELLRISGVEDVTFGMGSPIDENNSTSSFSYPAGGITEEYGANFKIVDTNYMDFYGLELLAGRNIRPTDSLKVAVVNEQVIKILGFKEAADAIGVTVKTGWAGDKQIVGVVKDFHTYSLHSELSPVVMIYFPRAFYSMDIKLAAASQSVTGIDGTLREIDEVWSKTFPDFIFDYDFLDSEIGDGYQSEKNLAKLFLIFAGIAIFIGGFGLYGLISFLANQRTKEIGIRKVLGASVAEIILIFSREAVALMIVAFFVAAPVSYLLMDEWLSDFAYKAPVNALVFFVAIFASFIIAVVSTGHRSLVAARSNPVDSLRSE